MERKLLIGSRAIQYWFPDFEVKPTSDFDYLTTDKKGMNGNIEWHQIPFLLELNTHPEVLDPDLLYTLKMSHLVGWDIKWDRHMFMLQFLIKKGCTLNNDLFDSLYQYWNTVHGKNKRSDLQMSAEDFFDNAVKCEHDHDYLHTVLIKHPHFKGQTLPTYTKILIGEVEVSEELFNTLSHTEKYNLVFEECAVMATERMFHSNYKVNYHKMLKKFLMNHAPMWEAKWIISNWVELHKAPFDFVTFLNNQLCKST